MCTFNYNNYEMQYVMFMTFFKNNNIIRSNIKNILFIIIKEVRNQILGLWASQSLDGIT